MQTVYLAGAIGHVAPEFAITWRRAAKYLLEKKGYRVLDPTDGKDLFDPEVHNSYQPEEIVIPDLKMIESSDVILAEMSRTDVPYHGTSMELVYGRMQGKLIYVWGGCTSYWVQFHADQIFATFGDAIDALTKGVIV